MADNFNMLVNKLNAFKLKYYLYGVIRGLVLTTLTLILLYTLFVVVEYFAYLSPEIRKAVFFGSIVFASLLIIGFILVPVLRLLSILKPIDLHTTSNIIQKYFTDIQDKLLNVIELSDYHNQNESNEIVLASIEQKIEELKFFDFNEAISLKDIKGLFIYLIISLLVAVSILLTNQNIFSDSTNRFIHYNQVFVKPAPFIFNIQNKNLKAKKGESFVFKVQAQGEEIPQIVYINIEGNNYLMKTVTPGSYEFEMQTVINPVNFHFTDLKYNSDNFYLELLPKPALSGFSVHINPPVYTGSVKQVLNNIGDLQVPVGTELKWEFSGIDVDSLTLVLADSIVLNADKKDNVFELEHRFYQSSSYNVYLHNKLTESELALSYFVETIPDLYPEIDVAEVQDSLNITRFFYKGLINDDYGFSNLKFHYNVNNEDSAIAIPFVKSVNEQDFYFSYDFSEIPNPEGIISYYFSVSDNDIVNNYKTTTSKSFTFKFPDKEELKEYDKEQFNKLQNMLQKSKQLSNEIQKDLNNLQIKNMDTSVSDWEKSQMVNDIVQKQNNLEKLYDQIKEDNQRLNNYLNSFNKQNEEIAKKQKQIEELLEDVFTDELKKLMEEFNKLAEEFDSKKLNELTKNMNLSFEDLQEQLDRNLEMLKKMKIEQKIQDVIDQVNEVANEHDNLAEEVIEQKNYDEIENKVDEHLDKLKDLQDEIKEALEMNKELEEPLNFDDFSEEFSEIEKSSEESKENLQKRNKKKSSKSIKSSAEQMKNMAFGMQQLFDINKSQQNKENIQNLRQILDNLVYISFSQETILNRLSGISAKDPQLVKLNIDQKRIVNQTEIVKDSLYSLALRTPSITSTVNNELISLEMNLGKAVSQMEEALFPAARNSQQFVITSANNLALMLNEALENLEKQQANGQPGDQQCENPGGGKPGMNNLKESSESIKQQLEKMIEQMKSGKQQGMSQQLGQSLMQHEMMQQLLRDLMNNGSVGSSAQKTLKQIDNMLEQNRRELMSRSISAQTLKRQNLITTRLLEAEKAEQEREFEDKRESESAEEFYSNPVKFFEYKEVKNYSIEYLEKNRHKLNRFYNKKYKDYLNTIEN